MAKDAAKSAMFFFLPLVLLFFVTTLGGGQCCLLLWLGSAGVLQAWSVRGIRTTSEVSRQQGEKRGGGFCPFLSVTLLGSVACFLDTNVASPLVGDL